MFWGYIVKISSERKTFATLNSARAPLSNKFRIDQFLIHLFRTLFSFSLKTCVSGKRRTNITPYSLFRPHLTDKYLVSDRGYWPRECILCHGTPGKSQEHQHRGYQPSIQNLPHSNFWPATQSSISNSCMILQTVYNS